MSKVNSNFYFDLIKLIILLSCFIAIEVFITKGDFFFTYFGWIDHWLYLGQFEYFSLSEQAHVENYKSSRLIWVWQNIFLFKIFTYPFNTYIISIFSLFKFWIIFWLVAREYLNDKRQALFFIAIFVFYPTLRQNGGWYYHNFEAVWWWLLGVYVLRLAQTKKIDVRYIFFAGFFAGFAINTNLYFINFLPIFILLAPEIFYKEVKNIIFAGGGLLGSVAILSILSFLSGGGFHYYLPMYEMIMKFNGAPELLRPLLNSDSVGFFIIVLVVAIFAIVEKIIEYKKGVFFHYRPLSYACLYTSSVYFFWHLKGVEVLSVNIHNSLLLVMGILMFVEVSNDLNNKIYNNYLLCAIFFTTLISFHFSRPFVDYFNAFGIDRVYAVLFSLVLSSLFYYIILRFKNSLIWIFSLVILPAGMATHTFYPEILKTDQCESRTKHDIIFDMKTELQRLSSPVVIKNVDNNDFAKTLTYIGLHKVFPELKYVHKDCTYENKGIDIYRYLAVLSHSKDKYDESEIACKKFVNLKEVAFKKSYLVCGDEEIHLTVYSVNKN